jgi:hypothetical protein
MNENSIPERDEPTEGEQARTAEDLPLPGGDFRLFVQKLGYQALISLGIVENPLTREHGTNLAMARGVIDDLMMLRDKTEGNLTEEEAAHIQSVVGEVQQHFVALREREPLRDREQESSGEN